MGHILLSPETSPSWRHAIAANDENASRHMPFVNHQSLPSKTRQGQCTLMRDSWNYETKLVHLESSKLGTMQQCQHVMPGVALGIVIWYMVVTGTLTGRCLLQGIFACLSIQ